MSSFQARVVDRRDGKEVKGQEQINKPKFTAMSVGNNSPNSLVVSDFINVT